MPQILTYKFEIIIHENINYYMNQTNIDPSSNKEQNNISAFLGVIIFSYFALIFIALYLIHHL